MIEQALGENGINFERSSDIKASGLLDSHYAPKAKISLNSTAKPGEGFLALSNFHTPEGAIRLASPITTEQFARELYSAFRFADRKGLQKIVVLTPEGPGLANAIKDRLLKASHC